MLLLSWICLRSIVPCATRLASTWRRGERITIVTFLLLPPRSGTASWLFLVVRLRRDGLRSVDL
jgi:hypothetical protein